RVPFFIVWGVVRRGPSTPYGFFISFLPWLVRFSPNTLVLVSLSDRACPRDSMLVTVFFGTLGNLEIFCPGVIGDSASRLMPRFWKGQDETVNLELVRWGPQSSSCGLLEISRASYGLIRSGCKRSSVEEARSLNLLLDSPSLARVSRHLATHGDSAYRPSSHPSWGMMLLWAEPAGVRKFCKGPWPGTFPRV
ncbi:LOW QUALITY PROTEIN: hypothetical protein HID58_055535, partial [Brassica napus]